MFCSLLSQPTEELPTYSEPRPLSDADILPEFGMVPKCVGSYPAVPEVPEPPYLEDVALLFRDEHTRLQNTLEARFEKIEDMLKQLLERGVGVPSRSSSKKAPRRNQAAPGMVSQNSANQDSPDSSDPGTEVAARSKSVIATGTEAAATRSSALGERPSATRSSALGETPSRASTCGDTVSHNKSFGELWETTGSLKSQNARSTSSCKGSTGSGSIRTFTSDHRSALASRYAHELDDVITTTFSSIITTTSQTPQSLSTPTGFKRTMVKQQFKRLTKGRLRMGLKVVFKVVNEFDSYIQPEDIMAVLAWATASAPQDVPSRWQAMRNIFSSSDACKMDKGEFLFMMTCEEVPYDLKYNVGLIREAFNEELHQHVQDLKEIAITKQITGGHSYEQPLAADAVGAFFIVANALVLGLSADIDPGHVVWRVLEYVFLTYFTGEVLVRVYMTGCSDFWTGKDRYWNFFDVVLACIAVIDASLTFVGGDEEGMGSGGATYIWSRTCRALRLTRLVRLLRFKFFSELNQMIYGVFAGLRVLAWAIVLLLVFIYMVSILLRQTIGLDQNMMYADLFSSMPTTMFTLFRCFTEGCSAPDGIPLQVYLYDRYGYLFLILYVITFLFVSIGIFNLIMATFVNNVAEVHAARDRIERASSSKGLKLKLINLIINLSNKDFESKSRQKKSVFGNMFAPRGKGMRQMTRRGSLLTLEQIQVSRAQFQGWLSIPEMSEMLREMDIAIADPSNLFDALDVDLSGELEGFELVEGLMALRGPTEKVDVISGLLAVRYVTVKMHDLEARLNGLVREQHTEKEEEHSDCCSKNDEEDTENTQDEGEREGLRPDNEPAPMIKWQQQRSSQSATSSVLSCMQASPTSSAALSAVPRVPTQESAKVHKKRSVSHLEGDDSNSKRPQSKVERRSRASVFR